MLERTSASITRGIAAGLHLGAQLYISRAGGPIADLAYGEARPGVQMSPDSINLWMSSCKPVAAVASGQLWERGLLDLDDPVTKFIAEFGRNGKEAITLRHILTHTAGFRAPPRSQDAPWKQIIAELCAARLESGWIPGRKAGYHPASSWYILGEIIRRLDGRDYSRYVREMIFEPLGMRDSWVGMSPEQFATYGERIASMPSTSGAPGPSADVRAIATTCRPGSSGCGPIRELGRLYEMLRDRKPVAPSVTPILSPPTIEALVARHRAGMFDLTFKAPIDWGLGFLLNSPQPDPELPYGYGPYASPRTFGHGGSQSSGGFCDPERGLVVAYVFNGMPGEARHHERRKELVTAIYEDLELAT